ncbi:MAG: hypothetical protein JNL98_04400 [Bryobacterales bacterium]|nr:hypothetical protein [Bryobacterales bacterium]
MPVRPGVRQWLHGKRRNLLLAGRSAMVFVVLNAVSGHFLPLQRFEVPLAARIALQFSGALFFGCAMFALLEADSEG